MANIAYLLQRSFVSSCLRIMKMKAFIPCEVEDSLTHYKGTILDVVFDPLRVEEVNARFKADGYKFEDDMKVIALAADESILLWGGLNSVFHLRRGELINGVFDERHLAFQDLSELIDRFKIKNKKAELDDLIGQLERKYADYSKQ